MDAMGCQSAIADKIVALEGDYVLALKVIKVNSIMYKAIFRH